VVAIISQMNGSLCDHTQKKKHHNRLSIAWSHGDMHIKWLLALKKFQIKCEMHNGKHECSMCKCS
jgi:hypothetical protein